MMGMLKRKSAMAATDTTAARSHSRSASHARALTLVSRQYDLDGDGILDEAEQAMRDRDVSNRGYLGNDEIYYLVEEQLRAQKSAGYMRKLVSGLVCFVLLLALSNLGTSWASAALARDLAADDNGDVDVPVMRIDATGEIAAVQTSANIFTATEMSDDEIEERRLLVLAEMETDPRSHAHRRDLRSRNLVLCRMSRDRDVTLTPCGSSTITFDGNYIDESDFTMIENQCKEQRNVYVKLERGHDSSMNVAVCSQGSNVVLKDKRNGKPCPGCMEGEDGEDYDKEKKNKKGNNNNKKDKGKNNNKNKNKNKKGGGANKKGRDRVVVITQADGRVLHADCTNDKCYCGGSTLQGGLGDRCRLRVGDDCGTHRGRRLVCNRDKNDGGGRGGRSSMGTCNFLDETSTVINERDRPGGVGDVCSTRDPDSCDGGGNNANGSGDGLWCEPDGGPRSKTGVCSRRVGWGQTCWHHTQCGGERGYCDGWDLKGSKRGETGVCRRADRRASLDEVCHTSYGASACAGGGDVVCAEEDGADFGREGYGYCRTSRVVVVKRAKAGRPCDITYGADACTKGYWCAGDDGLWITRGRGTCLGANRGAGLNRVCAVSRGDSACAADYACLGSNGVRISRGYGFCQTSAVTFVVAKRERPGRVCDASYDDDACLDGYWCVEEDGTWMDRGFGTCLAVGKRAGLNQVCAMANGNNACRGGYACLRSNGVRITRGHGFCQVASSASVVVVTAERARAGQVCDATYGNNACVNNYWCVGNNGRWITRGRGTCQTVNERARFNEVCAVSHGDGACRGAYACLGSNGARISRGYGFCQASTVVEVVQLARLGRVCDVSYGDSACADEMWCVGDNGRWIARGLGTCMDVARRADLNQVCAISHGNGACGGGYACLGSNGVRISRGYGFCQVSVSTAVGIRAGAGQACDISYDSNACVNGYWCVGNNGRWITRGQGTCLAVNRRAGLNQVCAVSYGNDACGSGYTCLGPNGDRISRGHGFCQASTFVAVQRAGLGQGCDASYGNNACAAGYACLGRNGVSIGSVGTGTCQVYRSGGGTCTAHADCTDNPTCCSQWYVCKRSGINGSDRWTCQ